MPRNLLTCVLLVVFIDILHVLYVAIVNVHTIIANDISKEVYLR